ncbi:MAG TPA: HAD-IA family hydrolase [Termitinemataceae bacterium]|uniref:HAD-IA family hydrolase n=1 Tax=Treponema sp. J25 TaxID=2094121 RepID=UPI00104ECE46|nr:HAD-IA family hydrolase [Treponema sp. J25]TCW61520.1 pyrimidine 5'-nucleotidase [Treponema sp. J25]HOJ99224.1 HAD-IA family hydrolase [Termitinemataceae bacterium]HOM23932.1 HAD-IA family hydrolase [Termitinemataceae bacterium]HPQ01005.1 HAD-IA family hydrolase [Termitinemataceae bacterium]
MISYILFDLDNTLYSSRYGLEQATAERIRQFTVQFLGLPEEEALARRQARLPYYGTTLEWLMAEEGLTDVEAYHRFIHPEGEEAPLAPDPRLKEFLKSIPLPLAVLTNSPMEHAERVIKRLELEGIFTHIFDIRWNNHKGKPHEGAFRRVVRALGKEISEVLFVDDYPTYVEGYIRLGGPAVLVDEEDLHPEVPYPRIRSIYELAPYWQHQEQK